MLNKIIKSLITFFLLAFTLIPVQAEDYYAVDVGYQAGTGGTLGEFAYGGALAGSEGGSALDSLEIHLVDAPYASAIEYRVYTNSGWSPWFSSFETATNNSEAILGIQVQLKDFPNANVYYQSYRQGLGWGIWVYNGHTSGTLNSAHPITGFRVQVDEIGINYTSNINGVTQVLRHNGETQGTGSLETVSMNLISSSSGSIEYRAYLRNGGWTDWASNGSTLGSSGAIIEALEARLVGLPQYNVQIQPQVDGEWWGYAYDGQTAGSIGSRLTAYRIEIVQKEFVSPQSTQSISNISNTFACPNLLPNQIYLYEPNTNLKAYYENYSDLNYLSVEGESETPFSPMGYWGNEITLSIDKQVLTSSDNLLNFYVLPNDEFNANNNTTYDLNIAMNLLSSDDKLYICYGSDFNLENRVYTASTASGFDGYNALEEKLGWFWHIGGLSYDYNQDIFTYNDMNTLYFGPTLY